MTALYAACPDCGERSSEDYGDGRCWPCGQTQWVQDDLHSKPAERVQPLPREGGPGGPPPRAGGPVGHPRKLRVLDVEKMLVTEPPPIPWVVEPLLADGCLTMLAGREGQGKSMLALALASAIGHGAQVAGLDCQQGRVLYIDAENGEREAWRRIRGLAVKPGQLVYTEAVGFNLATDVGELGDLADEHRPRVLVLDSLRSLAPGLDENDSKPVEAALRPVSRLAQDKGIPVLLLHHAGKQGVEYRGSTAMGAAVELGFALSRREEDPEKRTRRRLSCWKSRPAPEPEARWITLESRDGRILLGEAEPFEGDGSRPRDAHRDQVLDALGGIPRSERSIIATSGVPRTTAQRVLGDLAAGGLAEKREGGWARSNGGVAR
jgi:predicted ATP-dependent serine protease